MRLLDALVRPSNVVTPADFGFNGHTYPFWSGSGDNSQGIPDRTFLSYIRSVHERNGPVAAAVEARALPLSQIRFEWRNVTNGDRFENLWSRRLNQPGSRPRPEWLKQLEYDVSYSGAATVVNDAGVLRRLRPDRVSVVLGSDSDAEYVGGDLAVPHDAEVLGILYHPSTYSADGAKFFGVGQYARWCPEPDPIAFWNGTSWVTSVMREIVADGQATDHQSRFFDNAATPNLVFMMDPAKTADEVKSYADVINERHAGAGNAYRNMYLGGGTDVKVVGSSLESLNLKDLTGGLETRIALRARIPGVILGVREGYAGSSLNAGNYNSARRMFSDGWFAPTAESLCASLEALTVPPRNAELCYDATRILMLQEDQADAANIMATNAQAARQLVDGGFDPVSVVDALAANDLTKLVHTGKLSVQLQPPGEGDTESDDTP